MLKDFKYLHKNISKNKDIKKEDLFDGENLIYKMNNIKLEDR